MSTNPTQMATDAECAARRRQLIKAGVLKENTSKLIDREGEPYVSTKEYAAQLRKDLERQGLVSSEYFDVPSLPTRKGSEEGEYKVRPIRTEAQYQRRRLLYLRMLQEILVARRELKLNLAPRQPNDPDWVF
ncbi:MAG: hypothetical protein ACWGQW_03735 [bacterium]